MEKRTGFRSWTGPASQADEARQLLGVEAPPPARTAWALPAPEPEPIDENAPAPEPRRSLRETLSAARASWHWPGPDVLALPAGAFLALAVVVSQDVPALWLPYTALAAAATWGSPRLVRLRAAGRERLLQRSLREAAGIAILAPVLVAAVAGRLTVPATAALVAAAGALVAFDSLRVEPLPMRRAVAGALMAGAGVAPVAVAATSPSSPGAHAAILLVLWYGLRAIGATLGTVRHRRYLLMEYGAVLVVAAAAISFTGSR